MIGIIAAMQEEVDALLDFMEDKQDCLKDGIHFWQGRLHHEKVVVMLSGVGKGNAAMSSTLLMKNFAIDAVINIGTAGGLCADAEVLDLVISDTVVQYDYDSSYLNGPSGRGLYFQADPQLSTLCKSICETMNERYHYGLIASGDQFVGEDAQIQSLLDYFPKAMCAEMEAGAIAQVCTHFHVPFVIIRSLSDIAFQAKSNLTFTDYVHLASKRSAKLCAELMQKWHG